jgi:hypothetical protein
LSTAVNIDFNVLAFLSQDHVRLLREGETLPSSLDAGFEQLGKLDREWVWCLISGGEIKGALLACPCHGTAFVWRVSLMPGLGKTAILRLLRRFVSDIRKRGVIGIITILDAATPTQAALKGILERVGGCKFGDYELVVAPIPKEGV